MDIPLLSDILTIFGLSIGVLLLCARLRIPTIVGLLLTGVICGPHGLGIIQAVHEVEMMAEIGIVLLLFTIGLEFSLAKLLRIKNLVIIGGALQVIVTILCSAALASIVGVPPSKAMFFGFLVALSSTAIVLRLLQDRAQITTPHGQLIVAILIFQDIAVVPLMLMTPLLAGGEEIHHMALIFQLGRGLLILGAVFITARWLVPHLLFQIARTRNSQLFILCVLFLCLAVAWATSYAGLSLALGAFLAGIIISESEYSSHAVGNILPFQQVFTSFFFVSIGMLLNLEVLFDNLPLVLLIAITVLSLKFFVAGGIVSVMGYPLRTAIITGLGVCQVGEFAFILAATGIKHNLISAHSYQLFLATSLLTMGLTPLLLSIAPRVVDLVHRFKLPDRLQQGRSKPEIPQGKRYKDHLVIIGFGVCGRNLAWAARIADIDYVILEMNPETVRRERANGEPMFFGDATQEAVLEQVNAAEARTVVIAINDPVAVRRMVEEIRALSSRAYIIVRTRYLHELQPIRDLGADDVIPEEFETSIEIFTRTLRKYLIPQDEIDKLVAEVRSRGYQVLRRIADDRLTVSDLRRHLSDTEIGVYRVPEESELAGQSIQSSNIRNRFGVTVLMIRREEEVIANPLPDTLLQGNDLLVVFGSPEELVQFAADRGLRG